jgi:shikimate kinase
MERLKVTLIGFMGSGKTTVGELLSKELNLPFVDLDDEIVRETGLSIPEIFEIKGEKEFRKIENYLLQKILVRDGSFVLSTGGGTPAYLNNMNLINSFSFSVYLRAPFEVLWKRISKDRNRPLAGLGKERVKELFLRRIPYYERAHLKVDTFGKEPPEIVEEITGILKSGKGKSIL